MTALLVYLTVQAVGYTYAMVSLLRAIRDLEAGH